LLRDQGGRAFIHIGAAIILIAMVWFAIVYHGFRRLLMWVAGGIVGILLLIFMYDSLHKSMQQRAIANIEQQDEAQREAKAAKLGCYDIGHRQIRTKQELFDAVDPTIVRKWPSKFPACPGDNASGYVDYRGIRVQRRKCKSASDGGN
jgi:hypothetical protein